MMYRECLLLIASAADDWCEDYRGTRVFATEEWLGASRAATWLYQRFYSM